MLPYTDKVLDHFRNPRNLGKMKNPDAVGRVGNQVCGDMMELYLQCEPKTKGKKSEDDIIKNVSFLTFGCGAAMATSSMMTVMAKGKSIKEAIEITNRDVTEALGGLPTIKLHCSVLARQALKKAVENYFSDKGLATSDKV